MRKSYSGEESDLAIPLGLNGSRIVSARQAAELFGISLATFRRLHWSGKLPAAIHLSERRIGWRIADLHSWIASRTAA